MGETVSMATIGLGAGASYKSNQRAGMANRRLASAQKKANMVEQRKAEIANAREIERAVESARVARAMNVASQASQGGSSSAMQGANAAVESTLAGNIGFSNTLLASNQLKNRYLQKGRDQYNNLMAQSANWNAVGNLASQAGSLVMPS